MSWIVIPLLAGIIGFAATLLVKLKIQADKEARIDKVYEREYASLMQNGDTSYYAPCIWSPYYSFDDSEAGKNMAKKAMQQRVLDMPQLTFERWLNFYNNKPEAWVIQKEENRKFANIPYYAKITQHATKDGKMKDFKIFIPVFWKNGHEMRLYREWVEEQYQKGNAAVFDQQRDKNMRIFVDQMQEDIQERRTMAEAEIQKLREQTKQEIKKVKEEKPVKLRLSDGTEVDVAPTYHGMTITKYNGHDTASYAQYI